MSECINNLTTNSELKSKSADFSDKYNSNKDYFSKIPEYIIQNEIFSFLDSKELFFNIRAVNTEWSNVMKNLWCTKIKEEMIDQVKTIDLIYEKEVLAKTYEFKLEYLFNYRNLLTLYNANTNILLLIKSQLLDPNAVEDSEFIKLLNLLFEFIYFNEAQEFLINNNHKDLVEYLSNQEILNLYLVTFNQMINVETFHEKNEKQLLSFRDVFNTLSKIDIESISEAARLIYALLQGLIEFELLKYDVKNLMTKKKDLIRKIQMTTNEWPKKKKFFERAYKLLLYSK
jgi:hypothetical protein